MPLSDVKSAVLAKVIEFCKHHVDQRLPEIEKPLRSNNLAEIVPEWDAKFVDIEQEVLFELILAANYMDIKSLLDLTCAKVASMIKGKTRVRRAPRAALRRPPLPRRARKRTRARAHASTRRLGSARLLLTLARSHALARLRALPPRRPEQIRKTFNIRNDFTPEEEAQIIEENKWCEEV